MRGHKQRSMPGSFGCCYSKPLLLKGELTVGFLGVTDHIPSVIADLLKCEAECASML